LNRMIPAGKLPPQQVASLCAGDALWPGLVALSSIMSQPDTLVALRSSSKAALRMRRHRELRKNSLRCLIIELRETEVTALIRKACSRTMCATTFEP
jgi:hypothetical protein